MPMMCSLEAEKQRIFFLTFWIRNYLFNYWRNTQRRFLPLKGQYLWWWLIIAAKTKFGRLFFSPKILKSSDPHPESRVNPGYWQIVVNWAQFPLKGQSKPINPAPPWCFLSSQQHLRGHRRYKDKCLSEHFPQAYELYQIIFVLVCISRIYFLYITFDFLYDVCHE